METMVCSVKEACELMKHMDANYVVILTVIDRKTYLHDVPKKIKKKSGEELIKQADDIFYQNNDFFGTLSLYGLNVIKENNFVHNILFQQL